MNGRKVCEGSSSGRCVLRGHDRNAPPRSIRRQALENIFAANCTVVALLLSLHTSLREFPVVIPGGVHLIGRADQWSGSLILDIDLDTRTFGVGPLFK